MPLLLPPVIYTSYNNMIQSCVSKFSSLIPSPFSRFVLFSRQNGTWHIITALMSRSQAFAKETTSSYQDEKTRILSNNCGNKLCQKTPKIVSVEPNTSRLKAVYCHSLIINPSTRVFEIFGRREDILNEFCASSFRLLYLRPLGRPNWCY